MPIRRVCKRPGLLMKLLPDARYQSFNNAASPATWGVAALQPPNPPLAVESSTSPLAPAAFVQYLTFDGAIMSTTVAAPLRRVPFVITSAPPIADDGLPPSRSARQPS